MYFVTSLQITHVYKSRTIGEYHYSLIVSLNTEIIRSVVFMCPGSAPDALLHLYAAMHVIEMNTCIKFKETTSHRVEGDVPNHIVVFTKYGLRYVHV